MAKEAPNLENLLQLAITAIKENNKDSARVLLQRVLDADKKNDRAWVLMARVAKTMSERRQYLETALKYNPSNKTAQDALKKITSRRSSREQRTLMIGAVVVLGIMVFAALACVIVFVLS